MEYPLVIVGPKGWLTQSIEQVMGSLTSEGSIHYIGYVPTKDLPIIYSGAHAFGYLSFYEGFGLPVIEAMASEKPAIVSTLPGPTELIEEGKYGLTVKIGDSDDLKNKIEYLARNREICMQMGKSGRQKVLEKYSWSKINESLEKEFLTILKD